MRYYIIKHEVRYEQTVIFKVTFNPAAGASLTSAPLMAAQNSSTQTLIKPKALPKGGTIGVCSPSAATAEQADIILAKGVIEALGYKAKLAPNILARRGHLAGTDAMRAAI